MTLPNDICRCDGGDCPSKSNCRRYIDRGTGGEHTTNAALWCRREAGASACDSYLPVLMVTTFPESV